MDYYKIKSELYHVLLQMSYSFETSEAAEFKFIAASEAVPNSSLFSDIDSCQLDQNRLQEVTRANFLACLYHKDFSNKMSRDISGS